ncbi:MAG: hypothetical protein AAGC46_17100 [Solirubrobacteraceae bacterium]|nr:hypothetical protein [Patulibacter sp.]
MPLRKSHLPRAAAAIAVAAAAFTVPSSASAASIGLSTSSSSSTLNCAAQALSQPLLKFGDTASYWLAPGGDFETKAAGWKLSNAAVVSGNETLGVLPGGSALKLGTSIGTASATTPDFCVDPLHPNFRFLVKTNSLTAVVNTKINFKGPLGVTLTVPAKLNTMGNGNWTLSQSQPLATAIPNIFLNGGITASITFSSAVSSLGGYVTIDDLLIDPYRRG